MRTEIFAAEIFLKDLPNAYKHKAVFDEVQVRAYLEGLAECYDEVFILTNEDHVLFLASGMSRAMLVQTVLGVVGNTQSVDIRTSDEALSLVLDIASGDHWKEFTPKQIRQMFLKATSLSMDAHCMGELFSDLLLKALEENASPSAIYATISQQIKNPSFQQFDYYKHSLN